MTLLAPLTYGRGAYPMGKLDWVSNQYILVPLEVINDDSLDIYRSMIVINLRQQRGEEALTALGCMALSADGS